MRWTNRRYHACPGMMFTALFGGLLVVMLPGILFSGGTMQSAAKLQTRIIFRCFSLSITWSSLTTSGNEAFKAQVEVENKLQRQSSAHEQTTSARSSYSDIPLLLRKENEQDEVAQSASNVSNEIVQVSRHPSISSSEIVQVARHAVLNSFRRYKELSFARKCRTLLISLNKFFICFWIPPT